MNKADLQRASDPATHPDELRILAGSEERDLLACLASNPSTPADLLELLARDHPDQVLANPAFSLMLLEDPAWLLRFPEKAQRALAASPRLSASEARSLLGASSPVVWALASNPALPAELLQEFFVRGVASGALAHNPSTPPAILRRLARHQEESVRLAVARNPSADEETLCWLLGDVRHEVRKGAAASPKIPAAWRRRLARLGLGGDLAGSPFSPPERIPPDDLAPLLCGPPWFLQVVGQATALTTPELLALVRQPGNHLAVQVMRHPLPACVVDWLLRRGNLEPDLRKTLEKEPRIRPEPPGQEALRPLRAPSLRAPVQIGQWLVEGGEPVEAGLPVLELLCPQNDAVVRLALPVSARVYPRVVHGQVVHGETLAGYRETPTEEARNSRASGRIRGLLAGPVRGDLPGLLPVGCRLEMGSVLEVPLPSLGESVVEAAILGWQVAPGERVEREQVLVTAGMDKCDVELVAPAGGVVLERVEEGSRVRVGEVFLRLLLFKDR